MTAGLAPSPGLEPLWVQVDGPCGSDLLGLVSKGLGLGFRV